jgi:hypothetical protein
MRNTFIISLLLLFATGCNNLEDANPSDRDTFVKFFEGPYNLSSAAVEQIEDGYVILGNEVEVSQDTTFVNTVFIRTDFQGNQIGEVNRYSGGSGKSFKRVIANGFNGYIVSGDSTFIDPAAESAANVKIASFRITSLNSDFSFASQVVVSDTVALSQTHPILTDYFAGALNLTSDGRIITIPTFKENLVSPEKQIILTFDIASDGSLLLDWGNGIDLEGNGFLYQNAKSVHFTDGKAIWASAISFVQGDFNTSWVTIPVIPEAAPIPDNFNSIGQTSTQFFVPSDIQPAYNPAFGYGVIGTYSELTDGSKGNIFFMRVNNTGNIIAGSDRYFDGELSTSGSVDKNSSSVVDSGEAIVATRDGGFALASSTTSLDSGKDILVIKVNSVGETQWIKRFGGSGDESVSSIQETGDGGLLLCGTNTTGGYSTIFLMKMDKNGIIKE